MNRSSTESAFSLPKSSPRGRVSAAALATLILATAGPSAKANQLAVDTDQTAPQATLIYDGEGFPAKGPNPAFPASPEYPDGDPYAVAGQYNALLIYNNAQLNLLGSTHIIIANSDDNTAFMRVGYGVNGGGRLLIEDDAEVTVGSLERYANLHVGDGPGTTGLVQQDGGSVKVLGSLNIGVNGGAGTYNITKGTLTFDHSDTNRTSLANLGFNQGDVGSPASEGVLNISGGLVEVMSPVDGPDPGAPGNTASVQFILGNRVPGKAEGNGTIEQTGGTLRINNGAHLYLSSHGNGTYNLHGGTLEIGGDSLQANYGNGAGTYSFELGGGMIKVIGSNLSTSVDATLAAGTTSVFDTNGFNATWAGGIHGPGEFYKQGTGTLTFSGTSRQFGMLTTTEGITAQTAGETLVDEFLVGWGTGHTSIFELRGGSIDVANFRVGDYVGTGTFDMYDGALTVRSNNSFNLGNEGGDGTFNLMGGTFTLNSGLHNLGKVNGNYPAGKGVLNVSGGLLELKEGGSLILGNRFKDKPNGTGTVNQTGGTVRISNGTLFLAGYGDGIYNLDGGVLEIGGNSLRGGYNNTTPTYEFNLRGGMIKVIGSDLNTSVDATLAANTTSVFDTNGFNATWAGGIDGPGEFYKQGAGTLTFSGTSRYFGMLTTTEGITAQTAGATIIDEFLVGWGTGHTSIFELRGGSIDVANFRVGDYLGTGTFDMYAGALTVKSNNSFNLGNEGGNGTFNLIGGTFTLNSGLHNLGKVSGSNPAGKGVLNVSGGLLELKEGGSLILGNRFKDKPNGTGVVNHTGGTVRISNGTLFLAGYGDGTYNLDGGTLEVGGTSLVARYNNTTSTYKFNLNSGLIKVIGSDLVTSVTANLTNHTEGGGVAIDTNFFNATWSGGFTGGGNFGKIGVGTLFLNGTADRDFGSFATLFGSVTQTAGTTFSTELMVGSTAGSIATYNMQGGTIDMAEGSTLRVGDFQGIGTFNQTGGQVIMRRNATLNIGNQGGTGTYNISAGTLTLGKSLHNLGRVEGSHPAGDGFMNISGGLVDLTEGGSLILGGRIATGTQGNGTLTQTGGTFRVSNGALYLAAYGNGRYDLNGGTLEIGGDSLRERFASGTGAYAFNLGGGTVKVIGSDLSTSVKAKLTSSTSSKINTNGLNATWSGDITGDGDLVKEGAGRLTLSGANNTYTGKTDVQAGTLDVATRTGSGNVHIWQGAALTGSGTVAGHATVEGQLAPGNSPGTLTFEKGLTLAGTTVTTLEIEGFQNGQFDTVAITGGDFTLGGALVFNFTTAQEGTFTINLFTLASGVDAIGNFGSVSLTGGYGEGIFQWNGTAWTYEAPMGDFTFNIETGDLSVAVVPEPSSIFMLVGGAAAFAWLRRRKLQPTS